MNITIVLHPGRNSGMSSPPRYRNKSSTGSTTKVVPISIMKYKDNVGFTPLFSIPSRLCTQSYLPCLSSSLPPFRNLDPGSHKRAHLPHLLHDGACVHFYRGRVQLCFFPRRVGSNCAYTLVRMTLFCFPWEMRPEKGEGVCLAGWLHACLCLSACRSVGRSACLSASLSACRSACLPVCLVCLPVCLAS